jgi:hypothetical protein
MSRVYFHTQHEGEAELLGSERAHMHLLPRDIGASMIPSWAVDDEPLYRVIRPELHDKYTVKTHHGRPWPAEWPRKVDRERLTLSLGGFAPRIFCKGGRDLDTDCLLLNTQLAIGSDALALMAKLEGQCEIHAWVDGPDRAWMADVIQQGLDAGLYRDGMGWDKVQELLRSGSEGPVVTSYSVCDGFPGWHLINQATWPPGVERTWSALTEEEQQQREAGNEAWYELPQDEQWESAMYVLRENKSGLWGGQISPEALRGRFGHGLSMVDLFR